MEADGIAGGEREAADVVGSAPSRDVGQRLEAGVLAVKRLGVEAGGREAAPPQVRAGDEFRAAVACHRIQRDPDRDILAAIDAVIGLVVVPGGGEFGAGLLHQHMFVEQAGMGRGHQRRRQLGTAGMGEEIAIGGDALPVAVIA